MIKPRRISPNSKIAIISPSNGLPHIFPEIYQLGLNNMKEILGLEIVELPTARMTQEELYKNPKLRAKDLNQAFEDDSIQGIITSVGGYESVRILPYLDTKVILNHPKLIMGFSDTTTFLSYFNYLGMVTFYGPSVMAGFAQMKHLPKEFTNHIKSFLFADQFPYEYKHYPVWTNGYKDWRNHVTLGECTAFYKNSGWTFLQGIRITEGELWGGCIEVLEFTKSTDFWPNKGFWEGKILFFETSEEKPSPEQVGYMLRNYGIQGALHKVNGIIFGRPKDYSEEEKEALNNLVLRIVRDEFGLDIPIVVDMDFGHTDPVVILPLGGKIRLNPFTNEITLLESPFEG